MHDAQLMSTLIEIRYLLRKADSFRSRTRGCEDPYEAASHESQESDWTEDEQIGRAMA